MMNRKQNECSRHASSGRKAQTHGHQPHPAPGTKQVKIKKLKDEMHYI